jgi:hypothetical protein
MCPILKKFSNTLQPYDEVVQIIEEILASKKGDDKRILEHFLQYGDYQFGKPIAGKDYHEREDGQRIANWDVDIDILLDIRNAMVETYSMDSSLSTIISYKGMFPHLERSLHILSPWMVTIDTDTNYQSNSLSSKQENHLLETPFQLERRMAVMAMNSNQFDVVEGYSFRCLVNARRIGLEGEDKTSSILEALGTYMNLRQC